MNSYAYEAVDAAGASSAGVLEVASQSEAVRRIKEMGLFPLRIALRQQSRFKRVMSQSRSGAREAFDRAVSAARETRGAHGIDSSNRYAGGCGFAAAARPENTGATGIQSHAQANLGGGG